jgi:hypothetical protein
MDGALLRATIPEANRGDPAPPIKSISRPTSFKRSRPLPVTICFNTSREVGPLLGIPHRKMPTVHWEAEEYRIRYHYSCLERFGLQIKLRKLERFFKFLTIASAERRRGDGNSFYARRRQFMGFFITYSCIKKTRTELFRKRESVLYPSFNFYPGASTDPWWEEHEALFFFQFRLRRAHSLQLIDEMELTGKIFKCSSGPEDSGKEAHVHNNPADLCIMVVLRSLSYPCSFKELVDIFGLPSNRISDMHHTGLEFIYYKYRKLVNLEGWVTYFAQFADVFCEYGCRYENQIAMIDGTFTESCRPGLRNVKEKNQTDYRMFFSGDKGAHGYQVMSAAGLMLACGRPARPARARPGLLAELRFKDPWTAREL